MVHRRRAHPHRETAPPRYGILSYVVDAFAGDPDNEVRIVPTSIVYDQQHEVSAISAEEMGGRKPRRASSGSTSSPGRSRAGSGAQHCVSVSRCRCATR